MTMFLQKLTKSYSGSLPVYEPLTSNHLPDHDTGSFSCTYSPQHSVGAARVTVQSAQIREPKGWRRFFQLKPSAWVKVRVLGRTKGGVMGYGLEGEEKGEIQTWREERTVGKTEVASETYTPNFGLKSYYALLGPYERQLELEVRNQRRWLWPFQRPSLLGRAAFLLPSSLIHSPIAVHPRNSIIESDRDIGEDSHDRAVSPSGVGLPISRSLSHGTASAEHEEKSGEIGVFEWAVQAPIFSTDMSRIEGYLLFNVFWYPAIPAPFPAGVVVPPQSEEEGAKNGDVESATGANTVPGAGIVSFTLHSIDHLDTASDRQIMATISLGWHSRPLHTIGGSEADMRDSISEGSANSSTESVVNRREMRRQRELSNDPRLEEEDQVGTVNKNFDSTFEFLCLDPFSTNIVIKVYEVYRGNILLEFGKKKREMVGHVSVPLLDLVEGRNTISDAATDALTLNLESTAMNGQRRDRVLSLMGHLTAKAKVCVEWRGLRIPEIHLRKTHS